MRELTELIEQWRFWQADFAEPYVDRNQGLQRDPQLPVDAITGFLLEKRP